MTSSRISTSRSVTTGKIASMLVGERLSRPRTIVERLEVSVAHGVVDHAPAGLPPDPRENVERRAAFEAR